MSETAPRPPEAEPPLVAPPPADVQRPRSVKWIILIGALIIIAGAIVIAYVFNRAEANAQPNAALTAVSAVVSPLALP